MQRIAALTGADVEASIDDTGSARSDGNWDLEYQVGSISARSGFDDVKVAGYDYRLASLNAGDLVFLGLNADDTNPDTFAMVATVDIPSGTTVYITDYSIFSNGNFQTTGTAAGTEGVLTWTTTSTVSAGTILAQTLTGVSGARTGVDDFGTVSTSGWTTNASFSPGGDQLIIFQGTNATTAAGATWIYAFSNQQVSSGVAPVSANGQWLTVAGAYNTGLTTTATAGSSSSFEPSGISSSVSLALTSNSGDGLTGTTVSSVPYGFDNMRYNGPTTGTRAQILAYVKDGTNWIGDDSTPYVFGLSTQITNGAWSANFTIGAGDSTAPTFDVAPATSSVNTTGFTATSSLNKSGTVYYVVVADGATAPTAAEVVAGTASGSGAALKSGNGLANTGPFDSSSAITGLKSGTAYDLYMVGKDAANN